MKYFRIASVLITAYALYYSVVVSIITPKQPEYNPDYSIIATSTVITEKMYIDSICMEYKNTISSTTILYLGAGRVVPCV